MRSQEKHRSVFNAVLQWCRDRRGSTTARTRAKAFRTLANATRRAAVSISPPRYFFDASLLFRRMDLLDVDRSDRERNDPLLFRELQGVCALCGSKQQCWQDLARGFDGGAPHRWWLYCPNLVKLDQISALYVAHTP